MPEGPELHLASLFVNRLCGGVVFTGAVTKSEVSKSPGVAFSCAAYRISAASRGKEVRLTLTPIKSDDKRRGKAGEADRPVDIVFRFGMSGYFRFTPEDEVPKHAHLRFHSDERPRRVLSFVDARRFGSWRAGGSWQPGRGPCIMLEYSSFRQNVLSHLSDRAFDRPICEALLNQKYFNGIGNYLRAEILFRLNIPPFVQARGVLEDLQPEETKGQIPDKKTQEQKMVPDLLRLCHSIPLEVVNMGGKGYDPEKADYSDFEAWLQCYCVDGMSSVRDHNGRTMWFRGDPGPLVPKDSKSVKKRTKKDDHQDQKVAGTSSNNKKEKVIQRQTKKEKSSSEEETSGTVRRSERQRRTRSTDGK